jgi:hypothetical protein
MHGAVAIWQVTHLTRKHAPFGRLGKTKRCFVARGGSPTLREGFAVLPQPPAFDKPRAALPCRGTSRPLGRASDNLS